MSYKVWDVTDIRDPKLIKADLGHHKAAVQVIREQVDYWRRTLKLRGPAPMIVMAPHETDYTHKHGESRITLRIASTDGRPLTPRELIEIEYEPDKYGLVTTPGKFEREMIYVPYFWQQGLEGMADSDDGKVYVFSIDANDRKLFPELARRQKLRLMEDDCGFVREL